MTWIHGSYTFGQSNRPIEVIECFYACGGRDSKGNHSAGWKARLELRKGVYAETVEILPTQKDAEDLLCSAINELLADNR